MKTINPKLRAMLDSIDNYMADGSDFEARELWDVLSALRGPDSLDEKCMKSHTTSVLRAKAFPRMAALSNEMGGKVCASMVEDSKKSAAFRNLEMPNVLSGHFSGHVHSAFSVLGLSWYKENK